MEIMCRFVLCTLCIQLHVSVRSFKFWNCNFRHLQRWVSKPTFIFFLLMIPSIVVSQTFESMNCYLERATCINEITITNNSLKKKCMMVIKRNTIKSTYKNHKSVWRRTSKEGREGRIIGWIIGFSPSSPCRFHTVYSAIPCGLRIHWRFQIGDHTETDWKKMQEIARNIDILIFLPGLHFITKENPHWFDFLLIFKKHLTFGNYMCIVYCIVFSNAIFSLPGNITNQSCVLQTGGRQDFEMSKLFRYCS